MMGTQAPGPVDPVGRPARSTGPGRWRSAPCPSPLWYDSRMDTDPQAERPAPARTAALVSVGCKVNQGELRQWGVSLARVGVKLVEPG